MFGSKSDKESFFNKYPQRFRLLLTGFAFFSLAVIAFQSYNNINTPTDENVFADPPSRIYISHSFPVSYNSKDSILAGSLLLEANGTPIQSSGQLNRIISSVPDSGSVRFQLYNQRSTPKTFSVSVQKSSIPPEFARYLSSAILIIDITQGGASDRAGLKVGDIIVKVNGETFASANEADVFLRKPSNNNMINYTVLRSNELFDMEVSLAKFGFSFRFIQQIISGIIFLLVGFFVAYSKPHVKGARLLGFGLFLNGFYTSINTGFTTFNPFFYQVVSISSFFSFICGIAFMIYGILNTVEERFHRKKGFWYRVPAIACVAVFVLGFIFGFLGIPVLTQYMTLSYSLAMTIVLMFSMLLNRYRRRVFRFPFFVIIFSILSQVITVIFFSLSSSDLLQYTSSADKRIDIFLFISALIPLSYLYAVGKHKLYGIVFRFTKSMQYNIFSLSWKLFSFIVLVAGLLAIVSLRINLPEVKFTDNSIEILSSEAEQNDVLSKPQTISIERKRTNSPKPKKKTKVENPSEIEAYSIELPEIHDMFNDDEMPLDKILDSDEDGDVVKGSSATETNQNQKSKERPVSKIRLMNLAQPQFDSLIKSAHSIHEYAKRIGKQSSKNKIKSIDTDRKKDSLRKPEIAKKTQPPADTSLDATFEPTFSDGSGDNHIEFGSIAGPRVMEILIYVLLATAWLFFFSKCSSKIQKYLDKKFYRTSFDYRRAQNELAEVLKGSLSKTELAREIVHKLQTLIGIKNTGVLLINKGTAGEGFGCSGFDMSGACSRYLEEVTNQIGDITREISVSELSSELAEVFSRCGFKYVIPVGSQKNLLALLFVGEKLSETAYRNEDLEFLRNTAGQIYIALENAILYEGLARQERIQHELELARNIQLASLPAACPEIKGLEISGESIPALEVGGDFYDYLSGNDGNITILIGDVSGKGTSAALHMSKTQGIFRTLNEFIIQPSELLSKANAHLNSTFAKGTYVTALAVKLLKSENRILIARAGHLPLYIYRESDKRIEKIKPNGLGLGLASSSMFDKSIEETSLEFNPGDALLLVTDGITEARNNEFVEFGEERMIDVLTESITKDPSEIRTEMLKRVREFTAGQPQYDDQTIIVVKNV